MPPTNARKHGGKKGRWRLGACRDREEHARRVREERRMEDSQREREREREREERRAVDMARERLARIRQEHSREGRGGQGKGVKGKSKGPELCWSCNMPGHFRENCPANANQRCSNPTRAVQVTGPIEGMAARDGMAPTEVMAAREGARLVRERER